MLCQLSYAGSCAAMLPDRIRCLAPTVDAHGGRPGLADAGSGPGPADAVSIIGRAPPGMTTGVGVSRVNLTTRSPPGGVRDRSTGPRARPGGPRGRAQLIELKADATGDADGDAPLGPATGAP